LRRSGATEHERVGPERVGPIIVTIRRIAYHSLPAYSATHRPVLKVCRGGGMCRTRKQVSVPHNYLFCYITQPVWQSSNENQYSNGKSTREPWTPYRLGLPGVWPRPGAMRSAFCGNQAGPASLSSVLSVDSCPFLGFSRISRISRSTLGVSIPFANCSAIRWSFILWILRGCQPGMVLLRCLRCLLFIFFRQCLR